MRSAAFRRSHIPSMTISATVKLRVRGAPCTVDRAIRFELEVAASSRSDFRISYIYEQVN